ncbi:TetR family transcriptional regulator [Nocardia tenerifensis]|uniref:TetR family transcriptional regulator n=1 Tax=Nocardia tenerifensis TaxID=228006 RepID=A0A318K4N3_9NOCA|nr:TetR/AcrR family transcriptional regulator [Nocardia tenerifensis]PXX66370.1 TetR family transcriptional regulator [Nocardia tenerifensis]
MPKIVDHQSRRVELAEAVWRVIARDGIDEISIRSVAAEAGWSSGALRHYFATRAELLAFACEEVITRVTTRIAALPRTGSARDIFRAILHETMPLDDRRITESAIAFSFVVLGLSNPHLAAVQRKHFGQMYELCHRLISDLSAMNALVVPALPSDVLAQRLHALVDGLSLQRLAGHLTSRDVIARLDVFLDEIITE